jgi:pyridoxamine 5'-phosphate oxidase
MRFSNFKLYQAFYLATTEGDTPHIRGIFLPRADENGIIVTTVKIRDLY